MNSKWACQIRLLLVSGVCLIATACLEKQSLLDSQEPPLMNGWKVTVHLDNDSTACDDGGRGAFKMSGNILGFYGPGMAYPDWNVALDADGSANKIVGEYIHPTRKVRVKVAAGTIPRDVYSLNEASLCGLRYIPD